MAQPEQPTDPECDRLQWRIALNIALDERVIDALAGDAAALREGNDPVAADLDRLIRTHRISIMRRRAVLGAAGIDV